MRAAFMPEVLAALLASVVTWTAWPWWAAQTGAWLPALPAALGLAATYAGFRVLLAPLRAAFSWMFAGRSRRDGPSTQ
jgi:hypothetical protein